MCGGTPLSPFIAAVRCPEISPPPHGAIAMTNENTVYSIATYTCDTGYYILGGLHVRRRCQPNGVWTGFPPGCYGKRQKHHKNHSSPTLPLIVFRGEPGSKDSRESTNWEVVIILHVSSTAEINCGSLRDPHHGRAIFTSTTLGSETYYECDPGYQLMYGDRIRTCMNNSIWSGSEPCCIRKLLVELLETVEEHRCSPHLLLICPTN